MVADKLIIVRVIIVIIVIMLIVVIIVVIVIIVIIIIMIIEWAHMMQVAARRTHTEKGGASAYPFFRASVGRGRMGPTLMGPLQKQQFFGQIGKKVRPGTSGNIQVG